MLSRYRSLVTCGPYAQVRHPIHASYLMFDAALAAASGRALAASLRLVEAALLSLRAEAEERLLEAGDPGFAEYKARVPYRFVPPIV